MKDQRSRRAPVGECRIVVEHVSFSMSDPWYWGIHDAGVPLTAFPEDDWRPVRLTR